MHPVIERFMGPTWGPSGADRTQVGPMLAPRTLLSGIVLNTGSCFIFKMSSYHHKDSYNIDKTASQLSYFYNGNPYTSKYNPYIDRGPGALCHMQCPEVTIATTGGCPYLKPNLRNITNSPDPQLVRQFWAQSRPIPSSSTAPRPPFCTWQYCISTWELYTMVSDTYIHVCDL